MQHLVFFAKLAADTSASLAFQRSNHLGMLLEALDQHVEKNLARVSKMIAGFIERVVAHTAAARPENKAIFGCLVISTRVSGDEVEIGSFL